MRQTVRPRLLLGGTVLGGHSRRLLQTATPCGPCVHHLLGQEDFAVAAPLSVVDDVNIGNLRREELPSLARLRPHPVTPGPPARGAAREVPALNPSTRAGNRDLRPRASLTRHSTPVTFRFSLRASYRAVRLTRSRRRRWVPFSVYGAHLRRQDVLPPCVHHAIDQKFESDL